MNTKNGGEITISIISPNNAETLARIYIRDSNGGQSRLLLSINELKEFIENLLRTEFLIMQLDSTSESEGETIT